MQPVHWQPSVELSEQEEHIMRRIRKAKLFVFLRYHRHELLDEAFQQELAGLYQTSKRGQPPIAPAQLALATIVQAYTGVSDDEVIEATLMDRRWQLVLDCLDTDQAPFSKGTRVAFRQRPSRRRWIDGSSNEPSSLPAKTKGLDHGHYVLHWIAGHCGEWDGSKIRTIS